MSTGPRPPSDPAPGDPASAGGIRGAWRRVTGAPRAVRLALVGVVIAVGFVAVVLPLFTTGGVAQAEISGFVPGTVVAGREVSVDIALDNTGDTPIYPVCVAVSGAAVTLHSADFQGLDLVTARGNRACGGQLTGQETISLTLVLTIGRPGTTTVRLVPQQGGSAIGSAFSATVTAT